MKRNGFPEIKAEKKERLRLKFLRKFLTCIDCDYYPCMGIRSVRVDGYGPAEEICWQQISEICWGFQKKTK